MAVPSSSSSQPLIESFARAGQGQVFAFWERLVPDARARLLTQAAEIDLAEIERLNRTLLAPSASAAADLAGLAPAPFEPLPEHGGDSAGAAQEERDDRGGNQRQNQDKNSVLKHRHGASVFQRIELVDLDRLALPE